MKKIAILSLVLFLLLASAMPVLASGGKNGGESIVMNGTIAAVDYDNKTITIFTESGPYPKGEEVVVYTTGNTRFSEQLESGGCTPIEFADLEVGDLVGVTGRFNEDDQFVAIRITVKIQ